MDLELSIVLDISQLAELVHEEAHARSRGSDHLREGFLAEFSDDRLRRALLTEIGEQKEQACEALLARIEQLIDQVLFNSAVSGQEIGHEKLGEIRLVMH